MRVHTVQTNMTGGIFSPRLRGRIDIARYPNAVDDARNIIFLVYGGAVNRDGTLFVQNTKDSTERSRMVKFSYNIDQSYVLEFGLDYIRFFTNGAQLMNGLVPYEVAIAGGYTEDQLLALNFEQQADTLFIFSGFKPIARLTRFDTLDWRLSYTGTAVDPIAPKREIGEEMEGNWTIVGNLITSNVDSFINADVGRQIQYKSLLANVTAFIDKKNVNFVPVAAGNVPGVINNTAADHAVMLGSPLCKLTPSALEGAIVLTADIAAFRANFTAQFLTNDAGDCRINGGTCYKLTKTSDTTINATVQIKLSSIVGAIAKSWELRKPIWDDYQGYPTCGVLSEQRLIVGGAKSFPTNVAASGTGDFLNFNGISTDDDEPFNFNVANSQDRILHLLGLRKVLALDSANVHSIEGGVEKPMTPTNIQIKQQAAEGASRAVPVRVGNELYFAHRSGKKLLSTYYDVGNDGFNVTEASKIAEHIAKRGIVEMAYQRDPYSVLWILLADGSMASVTIDKEENVLAWGIHTISGTYESITCIPGTDGDQLWVITNRLIDGEVVRRVELFDPDLDGMECAIKGHSGPGANVWSVPHLEGEEVTVLADGVAIGKFTVTDEQIDIGRVAHDVQIGIPFLSWIRLLPVEVPTQNGVTKGRHVRNGQITVSFLETLGATIKDQVAGARKFDVDKLDTSLGLFTGDVTANSFGWENGGVITIEQPHPLPMHVLSVVRRVSIND